MTERAYRHLEAAGYSRTTLRTLDLVLTKAYGEQTGLTLGAHRPRESDTLRPVWTLTEARRFLDHAHQDRLYPLWRLLLVTGLRRGELCGLQWRDLEPDLATLTVRRQRVVEDPASRVRDKPPKSHNSTRTLILDPATLKTLTATKVTAGSRYMFTGRTGHPLRPDNVTSRFNHLATRAGVRPIGPHQIRHLLASTYLDAGYGIHEVAERLGHDPGTLMRYYTRINATRRQQATEHIAQTAHRTTADPGVGSRGSYDKGLHHVGGRVRPSSAQARPPVTVAHTPAVAPCGALARTVAGAWQRSSSSASTATVHEATSSRGGAGSGFRPCRISQMATYASSAPAITRIRRVWPSGDKPGSPMLRYNRRSIMEMSGFAAITVLGRLAAMRSIRTRSTSAASAAFSAWLPGQPW
ncbi:site-specific integrase [Micromonospora sp. NPDC049374]|uniref:tyrosine-type recombinase/integrase n=1 Tax=Micromonospora sp. NPDC049374 TaxID=3154352 RepID=UPI00343A0BD9